MENLTPRQQSVFEFINHYLDRHNSSPTMQEIARHLGISGNVGVIKHLDALEKKGYIRKNSGARGIVVCGRSQCTALPVAGVVRAGSLTPAIEDIESYFSIDSGSLKGGTFFLKVKGDSMINAAILEGDLALVRPQPAAEDRDIVVAMVDGDATLKRFFREPGQIRLQPENPRMEPIIIREGEGYVSIIGKVVGIFRPFE
jgi:repressor LexA